MNSEAFLYSAGSARRLDHNAQQAGIDGWHLMQNAGRAAARHILWHYPKQPATFIIGPGNNGGDGLCTAAYLHAAGWPVNIVTFRPMRTHSGSSTRRMNLFTV